MMKLAISPWKIVATASVTLGLSLLEINPVTAQLTFSATPTIDTYLDSSNATNANTNFGTGPSLLIGQTTRNAAGTIINANTGQQIPLLKFGNLPTLSPGQVAIVTSASLVLQGLDENVNVTSLVGNPVRGIWDETTATFNNTNSLIDTGMNLFTASNPAIRRRTQGTTTYTTPPSTPLAQLVQSWLNGSPNNGLALRATNTVFSTNRNDSFASRTSTQFPIPRLNFNYNIVGDLGWQFNGRVGGGANPNTGQQDFRRTWETACTVSESQNPLNPPGPDHWFWRDNESVPFELTWNQTSNQLSVIFGGDTNPNTTDFPDKTASFPGKHTLNCQFSNPVVAEDFLRGFELSAFSQTDDPDGPSCKTAAGTETLLRLTQFATRQANGNLSFQNINVSSSAISPSTDFGFTTRGSELIFFRNDLLRPIEVVRGSARLNWPSDCNAYLNNGQSRLQFKIQGLGRLLNPPTSPVLAQSSSQSVPEPSVVLGLLAVGTLGIGTTLKHKRNDDEPDSE